MLCGVNINANYVQCEYHQQLRTLVFLEVIQLGNPRDIFTTSLIYFGESC